MNRSMRAARSYVADGQHPFRMLSTQQRLGLAAGLATASMVIHRRQSLNATSAVAPHGTLSFALTDHPQKARRIRSVWSHSTERAADGNFRLDMLFSLTWTNAIALSGLWAADQMQSWRWPTACIGDALAWAQWGAALLALAKDAENLAALRGRTSTPLERVGRWATITEIATKGAGITYAGSAGIAWLKRRHG